MGGNMVSNVTITYFPIRGRVDPSRLALEYAGIPYEMDIVAFDEMSDRKPSLPFGQVPVYSDNQVRLAQSNTILRYIGRVANLYSDDVVEQGKIDELIDAAEDALMCFVRVQLLDAEVKAGDLTKLKAEIKRWCTILESFLEDDYYVGNRLAIADLPIFCYLDNLARPILGLDDFPALESFRQRVADQKGIKDYVKSDRRPTAMFHPFVGILCNPGDLD